MAPSRVGTIRRLISAVRLASRPGGPTMSARLAALPRLVRAVVRGDYTGTSKGSLLLMVAALGYIISPIDVVPEGLFLALGVVDDAVVFSWLAAGVIQATEDFLTWEGTRVTSERADAVRSHVI